MIPIKVTPAKKPEPDYEREKRGTMSAGPIHSTKTLGMKGQRAALRGNKDNRKNTTPLKNFNVNQAKNAVR